VPYGLLDAARFNGTLECGSKFSGAPVLALVTERIDDEIRERVDLVVIHTGDGVSDVVFADVL